MTLITGLLIVASSLGSIGPQIQTRNQENRSPRQPVVEAGEEEYPGRQPILPADSERLRRAREAADTFIQRWRETLDLEVFLDEVFVSDPVQKRLALRTSLLSDELSDLREGEEKRAAAPILHEDLERETFVAMFNFFFLAGEYRLTVEDPETGIDLPLPPEIEKACDDFEPLWDQVETGNPGPEQVRAFLAGMRQLSSIVRRYLSVALTSPVYRENLKRLGEDASDPKVSYGWPEFHVADDVPVYATSLGLIRIVMIEEQSQFKVLALVFSSHE